MQYLVVLFAISALCQGQPLSVDRARKLAVAKGATVVTKQKNGLRLKSSRDELLEPLDNLVEPDFEVATEQIGLTFAAALATKVPPPSAPSSPPTVPTAPARKSPSDFVTGHRIPLELFSAETQSRIRGYVDSSAFRVSRPSPPSPPSPPSRKMLPPPPSPPPASTSSTQGPPRLSPHSIEGSNFGLETSPPVLEGGLSNEKDFAYFGSLDAFVPPDF